MIQVCFFCDYIGARRKRQTIARKRKFFCRLFGEDTHATNVCGHYHAGNEMPYGCREGHSYDLGCILKLIAGNLSERAYGEMMLLTNGNVQPFLDGEHVRGRHEE